MKKKCTSCKKKNLEELNEFELEKKSNKLVNLLIILYTLLAGYGLVRLIMDISSSLTKIL